MAVLLGAVLSALLVHYLGYMVLALFDLGIKVHSSEPTLKEPLPPKIVLQADDRALEPPVEIPEEMPEVEMPPEIPPELPDLEDVPLEEVVFEPGKTSIALDSPSLSPPDDLTPSDFSIDTKAIAAGMPEPEVAPSLQPALDSPLKFNTKEPDAIDPDEWYKDKLKGAGGVDDSHLPDGSKTLDQLMSQSDLGKDSGYSRLGADLLFEYDKAVLKNSAHQSMIRLAALMLKNPSTIFIVEGHTDSFGSEEYNAVLSLMRANAVRLWLQKNGISMKNAAGQCRLFIRACGSSRPVVSVKGDKNAQATNRRVEIHMRKPGEELPPRSLPDTYAVDMNTPVINQVRAGVGAKVKVSAERAAQPARPTPHRAEQAHPAQPARNSNFIPDAEPIEDPIPMADPVEEIPAAEPVEEIPYAEPPVENIPEAEPIVRALYSSREGGVA